jgi:hypothetical protein
MSAGRFSPPAPPGILLKGAAPTKKTKKDLGRSPRVHDEAYLSALRLCQCLSCGLDAGCEAAHVRMNRGKGTGGGIGMKPNDNNCLPLCTGCHRQQHAEGEQIFWDALDINPLDAARKLYSVSPDVTSMRTIVGAFLSVR